LEIVTGEGDGVIRKVGLAAAFLLASCATPQQRPAPEIAITIDDLPVHGPYPVGETPQSVAAGIIAALTAEHAPAYGFINGHWAADRTGTAEVFTMWRAAGLSLGNHGWSHRHLNEITPAEFEQELARNEPILETGREDWHWFRYPFLDEGWKSPKRAEARQILAKHGYKVAAVTLDFGDWMWTAPYARCKDAGDTAAVSKLEELYMRAARESIGYFRAVSHTAYGRDIPYVLLLHVSSFEARMLPRLLKLYRESGFRFVSLPEAEADPVYAEQLQPQLPADPKDMEGKAAAIKLLPSRTDFAPILDAMCKG
jgi:peptidoglycan/xylan/chitin deacetylase (PgdA/CDA1 family)